MSYFKYGGRSVYYEEYGEGSPVIFLHGNTASSKMIEPLLPLYAGKCRCILIDFLGNGRSDRVEKFPADLWYDEAMQTVALARHLGYGKVSLVGVSGGAWAAVNAALLSPELFLCVAADSFDGRTLNDRFAENLLAERTSAKADIQSRQFYEWCQGEDWEKVVDLDTASLLKCAEDKHALFCKPLPELKIPVLLMGTKQDQMCRDDLEQEYKEMAEVIPEAEIRMFEHGGHPASASNAERAAESITGFIAASERKYREKLIRHWFDMWTGAQEEQFDEIFSDAVVYTESWGPEYKGVEMVKHWFYEWKSRGKVLEWNIRQYFHKEDRTAVEWYFKDSMNDGRTEEFDGMSLIEWSRDNRIRSLKEFGCNLEHYNPYEDGGEPKFKDEKAKWF